MMIRFLRRFFLVILFSLACVDLHAATTFSVLASRPVAGVSPFYLVRHSKNLGQWEWSAGTVGFYGGVALQESAASRKIIDKFVVEHFLGEVGLVGDWFSFGFDMPVVWYNRFQDPTPTTAPGLVGATDLGDLRLEAKVTLLNPDRFPVGLALVPYAHLPTGNQSHFVGDWTVVGGILLAVDGTLFKRLVLGFNGGIELKEKVDFRNVDLGNLMAVGSAGAAVKIIPNILNASLEGVVRTPTANFFKEQVETPAEALAQVSWNVASTDLWLTAGGGLGLVSGAGQPKGKAILGVRYIARRKKVVGAGSEPAPTENGRPSLSTTPPAAGDFEEEIIHFDQGSARLKEAELPIANRVAEALINDRYREALLIGYSDTSPKENRGLSTLRAREIRRFLVACGVEPSRIKAYGIGIEAKSSQVHVLLNQ